MVRFHEEKGALCTLALSRGVRLDYGVGKLDGEGRLQHFEEKPILSEYPVSIGIYACQPRFLSYCRVGSDLAADILPHLISKGERVYGYVTDQPHHDIGSFKQLNRPRNSWQRRRNRSHCQYLGPRTNTVTSRVSYVGLGAGRCSFSEVGYLLRLCLSTTVCP